MHQTPRDFAIRPRSAQRDLSRLRIRKLELLRNALLTIVGLLCIAFAFAIVIAA